MIRRECERKGVNPSHVPRQTDMRSPRAFKEAAHEAPKSRGDRSARTRAHGSHALPNIQTESMDIFIRELPLTRR